ncbi:hypothetical protein LIQ25_03940 [Blautia glucerasea]|uniref:defense against restriction DarA-related protein n=1 Tax=Blautia TaxID=572511 RepID=UPI0015709192|nr:MULTISPECIES: hypothetical protein [Blautia]MCB5381601.1 hypothetical protein [Blautia glucerasea]NSJ69924.1 hypothetical protein [Blautia faecis]
MTYRYYSTQRPLTPGSCPRAGVQEVVNYDEKKFCEEIGMDAWGFVEYTRELTKQEADDYELTPAGLKKFWCVTTAFHDNGKVVSAITDVCEAAVKPENVCKETKTKDIYLDWFDTEEEAKEKVKEALNA